ncbi:MEDS domain-containing protein [Micromonospora siamensis]|uniref:MEDS: MEthanogen/methylotroph, DcmR Sensory domain n=1 Tax=Micromonospora siamensis TaxID=299152 RepID=A0A1C5HY77_9ACTN|nr:MEDS domain-containing protein [Micromonospora siamensis]SCG50847.1 MEDS: MEthanogen/methylotroph, DcmR Sensory domain [Micromonospora siamensis]
MTDAQRSAAPPDHVCWSYDDPAAFDAAARGYLSRGLADGEQVWYVGPDGAESARARLGGLPGLDQGLRTGAVRIVATGSAYDKDEKLDPSAQVRAYAAATEAALAEGYTGLRVVAEATDLARTPQQRDLFARYEHLVDRYMWSRPFAAMCAYDRRQLGDRAVAELACMHPRTNAPGLLFTLSACGHRQDDCVVLAGELDPSNHELFATALERADLRPVDGELRLCAPGLRFIDHRCLLHLQGYAARRGVTAVLHTTLSAAPRLVELLGLPDVRVEVTR